MRPRNAARAGAVGVALILVTAACGDDSEPSADGVALGEQAQRIVFDAAYEQLQAELEVAGGDEGALTSESAAVLDVLREVDVDPTATDLDALESDVAYEQIVNTLTDDVPALYNRWNSVDQALLPMLEQDDVDTSAIESAATPVALEVVFEDEYLQIYSALSGRGVDDELTSDQQALLAALSDDTPIIDPAETTVDELKESGEFDDLARRVVPEVPHLDAIAGQLSEQIVEHAADLVDTRQ